MNPLTAKPKLLKQANLSLIRKTIKSKYTATRAEITKETNISSTTVRSLLTEMLENGEIESIGFDESSGGRKAERYRFKPDRYYGAAFCITDSHVHSLLVNICGEITEAARLEIPDGNFEVVLNSILDDLVSQKEIKSIGIGVSGIVEGGCYWKKNIDDEELYKIDIGNTLAKRYGIPVAMENNLNATAIGFSRCYKKEFPHEASENMNMAYLHFEGGCVSAGLIAGGRVIRGSNNFAGELGLVPMDNHKLLDEYMSELTDDTQYINVVIKIIGWICGILNPQYVVLSGSSLREKNCIETISTGLSAILPSHMLAEILYSPDVWHDYYDGIAYLTAERMFEDVQFIKE